MLYINDIESLGVGLSLSLTQSPHTHTQSRNPWGSIHARHAHDTLRNLCTQQMAETNHTQHDILPYTLSLHVRSASSHKQHRTPKVTLSLYPLRTDDGARYVRTQVTEAPHKIPCLIARRSLRLHAGAELRTRPRPTRTHRERTEGPGEEC